MGFASDISNQVAQSAQALGQNTIPGNVVGNMGAPTMSGKGGAASPIPGNNLGINPPGGTGGGYNTGAPDQGNNSMPDMPNLFGKGGPGLSPGQATTTDSSATQFPLIRKGVMPGDYNSGLPSFFGLDATQNPLIRKGVMPSPLMPSTSPPMMLYNRPIGQMPPGQVNMPTPAQRPVTRTRVTPAPVRRMQPLSRI